MSSTQIPPPIPQNSNGSLMCAVEGSRMSAHIYARCSEHVYHTFGSREMGVLSELFITTGRVNTPYSLA